MQSFFLHTLNFFHSYLFLEPLGFLVPSLGMYRNIVPFLEVCATTLSVLCSELGFHNPAGSCRSCLKLNCGRTFIYELYYILLKITHKAGTEVHCCHATEGLSVCLCFCCCPWSHTRIVLTSTKLLCNLNELTSVEISGKLLLYWYSRRQNSLKAD